MTFTGEFSVKLNAKNQVTLPSILREALFSLKDALPLILFDREGSEFVELYPRFEWELAQRRTEKQARIRNMPELNRLMNRRAFPLHLDQDGNGRVVIPQAFMARFRSGGEAVFVGNTRKIELWDAEAYRSRYVGKSALEETLKKELGEILEY